MKVQRNLLIGIGAAVSVLLVAVVVLLVIVMNQNAAESRQAEHDRIVAACKYGLDDPWGKDLQAMTDCMDRLINE